jgi:hypothetical protein
VTDAQLLKAHEQLPEPIQPGKGALTTQRRARPCGCGRRGVASPRWGTWGRYRRWTIAVQAGCPV